MLLQFLSQLTDECVILAYSIFSFVHVEIDHAQLVVVRNCCKLVHISGLDCMLIVFVETEEEEFEEIALLEHLVSLV